MAREPLSRGLGRRRGSCCETECNLAPRPDLSAPGKHQGPPFEALPALQPRSVPRSVTSPGHHRSPRYSGPGPSCVSRGATREGAAQRRCNFASGQYERQLEKPGRSLVFEESGGEGGIRTLGTGVSPYNGLANRRLQPLGHLSGGWFSTV